jgi:hypothetical protein
MARLAAMLVLAVTVAASSSAKDLPSIITAPTVRSIESQIVMPRDARPLANYDRYYMLQWIGRDEFVVGRFLERLPHRRRERAGTLPVPGILGAFTVARDGRLPDIADGGCTVVTIYFEVSTWKVMPVQYMGDDDEPELAICNGIA